VARLALQLDRLLARLCYAGRVPAPPASPDPRIGSVIQGRYQILSVIASGGMGVVYRGERVQLGRPVAIKFLHPAIATQQSFRERFEVEARAMSRLAHPNCVSVIDFGIEEVPFLVMDFVAGRSLRSLLGRERLAPSRVLGFARQILAAVAHAHAQGIIHRDLKPDNIIVSDSPGLVDHVRILDFGLAKLKDGPALTVGMAVGTPSYMAPEQTLAGGVVDARTDIYAVGVLLFEMLTGKKPFASENLGEIILMHQQKPVPRMSAVVGGAACSAALEAVVAKALAKTPAARFADATLMAAALEETPEAAALRAGGTSPGLAAQPDAAAPRPTAPRVGPAAGDSTAGDRTIVNPTILEQTEQTEQAEQADTLAVPRPSRPGKRRWQRLAPAFARPWGRRQWLTAGIGAGGALASIVVLMVAGALARGHRVPVAARPAPPPAAAPAPLAMDELSPMTPDTTPGLAEAAALIRSGQREPAIASLKEIRRAYPGTAYASFLLAVAHLQKLWWSVGLQYAQAAIAADPAYRRSPALAKLFVYSLMSDAFWEKAAALLTHDLAEVAPPYLEQAAQHAESPRVRARAIQILASLGRAPTRGGP
jgi:hypothetical protein